LKTAKVTLFSITLLLSLIFEIAVSLPVTSAAVNTTQQSFVLSNEGANGISALVTAGYGDYSLYDILIAIDGDTNPSISIVFPDRFLSTLAACPASSPIFTTNLSEVNSQGTTVAISTDGTFQTVSVYGSTYYNTQGSSTFNTEVSGVGNFRAIYNSTSTPLTSWTSTSGGVTTTYNVFWILYEPSTSTVTPTPTITPATTVTTSSPPSTPSIPEFPAIALVSLGSVLLFAAAIAKQKKPRAKQ
jgi:hypothetical protein